MKEITLDAVLDNLEQLTAFVDEELESLSCSFKAQMQIDVAIDEIFSNIARYAYDGDKAGTATVQLEELSEMKRVRLTFIDQGTPYNPLAKTDPDVTLSAQEREIGGLGIFLVKKTMDDMKYSRIDGKNILILEKSI